MNRAEYQIARNEARRMFRQGRNEWSVLARGEADVIVFKSPIRINRKHLTIGRVMRALPMDCPAECNREFHTILNRLGDGTIGRNAHSHRVALAYLTSRRRASSCAIAFNR